MARHLGTWIIIVILHGLVPSVDGQAKLIDPPGRSSMWRYGFEVPENKYDNQLNCGGIHTLKTNSGKCGVCGDSFSGVKENEYGGKYGTGIIGKNYQVGQTVPLKVHFSSGRPGKFEFKLCKLEAGITDATEQCLQNNILKLSNGSSIMTIGSNRNKNVTFNLVLPPSLSCERCVLQWTYKTSVIFGCNKSGKCCFGCGLQERYINCADISIGDFTTSVGTRPSSTSTVAYTAALTLPIKIAETTYAPTSAVTTQSIQKLLQKQKQQLETLAKLKEEMERLKRIYKPAITVPVTTPPTTAVATTPPSTPRVEPNLQEFVQAFLSVTKNSPVQGPSALMNMLGNIKLFEPSTTPSPLAKAESFLKSFIFPKQANRGQMPYPNPPQQPPIPPNPYSNQLQQSPMPYSNQPQQSPLPYPPQAPMSAQPNYPPMPPGYPGSNPFPPPPPQMYPQPGANNFRMPPMPEFSQMPMSSYPRNSLQQNVPMNPEMSSSAADLFGLPESQAGMASMMEMMGSMGNSLPMTGGGEGGFNGMGMGSLMNMFNKMSMADSATGIPKQTETNPQQTSESIAPVNSVPEAKPDPIVQPMPAVVPTQLQPLTIDTISDTQRTDILEKLKLANVVMSKQVPPVGFKEKLEAYRLVIDSALKKINDERTKNTETKVQSNTSESQNPQMLMQQQQQISQLREELERLKNSTRSQPNPPVNGPFSVGPSNLPFNAQPTSEVQMLESLLANGGLGLGGGMGGMGGMGLGGGMGGMGLSGEMGLGLGGGTGDLLSGLTGGTPPALGNGQSHSAHPMHSSPIDFRNVDPFTLMGMGGQSPSMFGGMAGMEPVLKCDFVGAGEVEWACMLYCDARAMRCVPKRQYPQFKARCATDCAVL